MLVAAAALLVHLFGLATACSFDTSYCAQSSEKNGSYAGHMFNSPLVADPSGRYEHGITPGDRLPLEPYANQTFYVRFESRDREGLSLVPFHTDAAGNFCVSWANERITPSVEDGNGLPLRTRSTLPVGETGLDLGGLRYWQPGHPPGCEESDEGIPWNRADGLGSSWRSWLLIILPVAAIGLLLASIARRRDASARSLHLAGLAVTAASALSLLVLWNFI
jgi:hypothetical protein